MAERRMFTDKITESDAFLDMPLSTQALYFHLCMNADDDGFVNNPKRVQRMLGASEDDLKLLCAKAFVIAFEKGIIVIKHWRMHNLLRKDRYKETEYLEEKAMLYIKDNGAYTLEASKGKNALATKWQPNDNQMAPQDSIGKDSIGKEDNSSCNNESNKIIDSNESENTRARMKRPTLDEVRAYCEERHNSVDAQRFVNYYDSNGWKIGGRAPMKDWKAAVRTWERNGIDDATVKGLSNKHDYTDNELNSLFTRLDEGEDHEDISAS